jgi:hypothetical protein
MRGLLSETVNHKLSAEGIILWVPTLEKEAANRRSAARLIVNSTSPPGSLRQLSTFDMYAAAGQRSPSRLIGG